jgi:hypothetical protein
MTRAFVIGGFVGLAMFAVGGLIPPPPAQCPKCLILTPEVTHPDCQILVTAQGRTCD